jgi:hypothetical protein
MDAKYVTELVQMKSLFTLTSTGIHSSLPYSLSLLLLFGNELFPTTAQILCLHMAGKYNWQFFFTGNLNDRIDLSTDIGSNLFNSLNKQFDTEGVPEMLLQSDEGMSD